MPHGIHDRECVHVYCTCTCMRVNDGDRKCCGIKTRKSLQRAKKKLARSMHAASPTLLVFATWRYFLTDELVTQFPVSVPLVSLTNCCTTCVFVCTHMQRSEANQIRRGLRVWERVAPKGNESDESSPRPMIPSCTRPSRSQAQGRSPA